MSGALPKPPTHRLYAGLSLLCALLWGSAAVATKAGLMGAPPLSLMSLRFTLAGALLFGIGRLCGLAGPTSWRAAGRLAVLGLLNNALYMGLSAVALQSVSAGLASILASANSLWLALGGWLLWGERLTARRLVGLGLGGLGLCTVMFPRLGDQQSIRGIGLALLANLTLVSGNLLFKRWPLDCGVVMGHAVQLLAGGLVLLPAALWLEAQRPMRWDAHLLASVAYLVVAVSYGAMLLWLFLLRQQTAGQAGTFLFLVPICGVLLGAGVLGEPLSAPDMVGCGIVAAGVWLGQQREK
jgi:drug/metabolite transporter (DMT)-like permease